MTTCGYCNKPIEQKFSRYKRFVKHYCSNKCRYLGRTKDIDDKKTEILEMYESGKTAGQIAKALNFEYPRLCYHFHKWGFTLRKCWMYEKIMDGIGEKRKLKTEERFLERYRNGEISWRHTHDLASRVWKITERPCEICGWNEAERDMHLIIPRKLVKANAASLCPNHHRMFHRKMFSLRRNRKGELIVEKI